MSATVDVADAVRRGLTARHKWLPPFLFYDDRGSALFEEITRLPEYYLTRTERSILERDSEAIAARITATTRGPVAILELGAGSATKTELLLRTLAREREDVCYWPADVSRTPLECACRRLASRLPSLRVSPVVGSHEDALRLARAWRGGLVVLFLGSSIGNYADGEAYELVAEIGEAVGRRGALLLGVDRAKSVDVVLPAYDDSAGVTAAFNRNVLARINRELDADFDLAAYRHVAVWNEAASAVEMHLESRARQRVRIRALGVSVDLERGERIHTESSHKYSDDRLRRLFEASGVAPVTAFEDDRRWFSLLLLACVR